MRILFTLLTMLIATTLMAPMLMAADSRPNIVVMLVDDMGVMDTSVPFLTDAAGQAKRYPLNDYYRTPIWNDWRRVGYALATSVR